VPYFANMGCLQGSRQPGGLACEQADAIVRAVLRDLRLIGGGPLEFKPRALPVEPRPTKVSATFKYNPPGRLLKGTSEGGGESGDTTCKLHGAGHLGFPIKLRPVYANSQVFMHSGNCQGDRQDVLDAPDDEFDHYKCKQNGIELLDFEGHRANYDFPWRDNYCEARSGAPAGSAPGCPQGKGHAGQDLRPWYCIPARDKGTRCKIDVFEVVAVADGNAWWKTEPYENHMRLMLDGGIYFMYLHMSPSALWNAGMEHGRAIPVTKGQVIGMVGNFDKAVVGGTSTHLHFEIRYGYDIGAPVSPYWTLVRAYELHINARGTEVAD
jgi:Peptidase family M23